MIKTVKNLNYYEKRDMKDFENEKQETISPEVPEEIEKFIDEYLQS